MYTCAYGALVSATGFVFALAGFILSLLSVLLSLLLPALVNPATRAPTRQTTRSLPVSNKQNPQIPVALPSAPPASKVRGTTSVRPRPPPSKRRLARRSIEPPPLPTATPQEKKKTPTSCIKRRTTITFIHQGSFPTPSTGTAASIASERVFIPIASQDSRYGLKVSTKCGEKRPELYRCVSSPHLVAPATPDPTESQKAPPPRKKRSRLFRRESCDNYQPRSASLETGVLGRKKSSDKGKAPFSRTNPYAAPYFVPLPVPSISSPATPKRAKLIRRDICPPCPPSPLHAA